MSSGLGDGLVEDISTRTRNAEVGRAHLGDICNKDSYSKESVRGSDSIGTLGWPPGLRLQPKPKNSTTSPLPQLDFFIHNQHGRKGARLVGVTAQLKVR